MSLGTRIRELRKKNGLTQTQLGEKVGVDGNTVSRWELGKLGIGKDYILKLAQTLNTSTGYLLGETDDPKRYTSSLSELVGTDGNESSLIASKHGVPGDSEAAARLIYEQDGKRLDLPDTPENRELFEKLVVAMMAGSLKDEASASPRSAGAAKPA